MFTLQNKLKNIIIVVINLISIIIRDIAKTQKMRLKSAIDISRIKKIDKDNFDKFFDSRSDNLFQVVVTQILRRIDAQIVCSQKHYFELLLSLLRSKLEELQSQNSIVIRVRFQLNFEFKRNVCVEQE